MADVCFEVVVVKGTFCWLFSNCQGLYIAVAKHAPYLFGYFWGRKLQTQEN